MFNQKRDKFKQRGNVYRFRKLGNLLCYKNNYGTVILEPTEYQKVNTIHSKNIDKGLFITLDQAEQVTLITCNHNGASTSCKYPLPENEKFACYALNYIESSIASVCKVRKLKFNNAIDAEIELEKLNSYQTYSC